MSTVVKMQSLAAIATRVADLVPDLRLREALGRSFVRAAASVEEIEHCFELLPAKRWPEEMLSVFLHSWKATHLKMLAIYGLSCRIQRLAVTETGEAREQLWMSAARNAETSHEDLGLDYEGVTHAALYDDLARSFVVDRSPAALGLAKQMLYRNGAAGHPLEAHLSDSLAMFSTSLADGKEGVAAFLEKRPAEFTGRASELPRIS